MHSRYSMLAAAFAILSVSSVAIGHEADQYSVPVGREFADLRHYFSEDIYDILQAAIEKTNSRIKSSMQNGAPTAQTKSLQTGEAVAAAVYAEFPPVVNHVEIIGLRLTSSKVQRRYPGLVVYYLPPVWIYHHWALLFDPTKLVRLMRCPTIMINGTYLGTDKFVHFVHMGYICYGVYNRAVGQGASENEAVEQAVAMGNGNHPLSEKSLLGMLVTGVYSNADLAANYAGLKFFRNLTEDVRLNGETQPPMMVRDGEFWRLNDHVRREGDLIGDFVSPHWDEVLNPCVFGPGMGFAIKEEIKKRCADVLYWYRDETGSSRTRDGFRDMALNLTTYYGEEYGHRGAIDDLVSTANVCFPDTGGRPKDSPFVKASYEAATTSDGFHESLNSQVVRSQSRKWLLPSGGQEGIDALGRTPLWRAARWGRLDEVQILGGESQAVNAADIDGETPLHAAVRSGSSAHVECLIDRGARLDATAVYGQTPLHLAAKRGDEPIARILVKYGANTNARDSFGCTPLHDACAQGHQGVVMALIAAGALVDIANNHGTTPLHQAARHGFAEIVHDLVAAGADPHRPNRFGRSAIDEARGNKNREVIDLLAMRTDHTPSSSRGGR